MTGLIIGTFYSVKGIFQLFGVVISVPFTLKSIWGLAANGNVTENAINDYWLEEDQHLLLYTKSSHHDLSSRCELWYLVVTVIIGILAIVFFSVTAWKYKYRKREENPFSQADVEDIVIRNIERDPRNLHEVTAVEINDSERRLLSARNVDYRSIK